MASAAMFSSLRRRRSPSLEAFLAPVNLSNTALLKTLAAVAAELISSFSGKRLPFQKRNSRSLVRKIEVIIVMIDYLRDFKVDLPLTAILCFKELYLILYRSKILLDYCFQSSKLWLLLNNHSISGYFHDLNQEISTLLEVLPLIELNLTDDVREHIELLRVQSRRTKLFIDKHDEILRLKLFSFLNDFENGNAPYPVELSVFFIQKLRIEDAKTCRFEIEFLEEQIVNNEGDIEPAASVLNAFVAITRYCRFLLFGIDEDELEIGIPIYRNTKKKRLITQQIAETFITIPKDFCCPISLDLMRDPVIIWSGQTFEKDSISRWMEEGNCTCPKTGQILAHNRLVPNKALKSLITQWCTAYGISCGPLPESNVETFATSSASKAAVEANKGTSALLIHELANGSACSKTVAAKEIRLLAKNGKESRAFIAESGAIPFLKILLTSKNAVAQENSVTAMLNLSIYDKNKSRIMDEKGCLSLIVDVLRFGKTTEARENAAATLFSLSAVHDYKRRIASEYGAVESLARLLTRGTVRGMKDAVTALFNLSTHNDNCIKMVDSGAVSALVVALRSDGVAEEAAGALALIVRQPEGAAAVASDEVAVRTLIDMMGCGSPRGKENAVAALLELCRSGGAAATQTVLRAPALGSLIQTLLFTGTKRARRKAASLARVFQRNSDNVTVRFQGLGVGYVLAGNSMAATRAGGGGHFGGGDISMPITITVPVL